MYEGEMKGLRKASQKKLDIASGKLGGCWAKILAICKGLGDTAMAHHHKKLKVYILQNICIYLWIANAID